MQKWNSYSQILTETALGISILVITGAHYLTIIKN